MQAPPSIGFPPVVAPGARLLILGSMPGAASLRAGRYYAHPRNAFWPTLGTCSVPQPGLAYPDRLRFLTGAGVALWDVLRSCARSGSLDSAIRDEDAGTISPASLASMPKSATSCSNGAKAEQAFLRHVLPGLDRPPPALLRLPSTSPAHAGMSLARSSRPGGGDGRSWASSIGVGSSPSDSPWADMARVAWTESHSRLGETP